MSKTKKTNMSHPTHFVEHAKPKRMDAATKALIQERDQHLRTELQNPKSDFWRTAYPQLKQWALREVAKFREISVDDREDLAIRSIVRFWKYLPKFRGECLLYTCLCFIVKSECTTFLQKQKRYQTLFDNRIDACEVLENAEARLSKHYLHFND